MARHEDNGDGERSARPPRRRSRRIALGVTLGGVALGVAVSALPVFLLSRATARTEGCFRELLRTAAGDPEACRPSPAELGIVRRAPWFAADASRLERGAALRAASLGYDLHTLVRPSAGGRRRAAERLIELWREPLNVALGEGGRGQLDGAFDIEARRGAGSDDARARARGFSSARAVAALELLRPLAASPPDQAEAPASITTRGAAACLLGDREAGTGLLRQADAAAARAGKEGYGPARLSLLACRFAGDGDAGGRDLPEGPRPASDALEASGGAASAVDACASLLASRALDGRHRLRLSALVIGGAKPELIDALALLVPRGKPAAAIDGDALRHPSTLLDGGDARGWVLAEPSAARAAALHLEKLVAGAAQAVECAGSECPLQAALDMPAQVLHAGARMLWLEAAAELVRRGDDRGALEAVATALPHTPERRRFTLAAPALAAGDATRALELLGEALAALDSFTPVARSRVRLVQAQALAHLGQMDMAYLAAEHAFVAANEALGKGSSSSDEVDARVLRADHGAAAWLWAAIALASGKTEVTVKLLGDRGGDKELSEVSRWLDLALAPEERRRVQRWGLGVREPNLAILPAVVYVVGRAVPGDAGVEVWLDRMFDGVHRRWPLLAMAARAEAARWRGDEASEKLWRARFDRVRHLAKDYPAALLAHVAGLR